MSTTAKVYDNLHRFEARQSSDDVKTDLELTCTECGEHVCDIEPGDLLGILAECVADHECKPNSQPCGQCSAPAGEECSPDCTGTAAELDRRAGGSCVPEGTDES